MLKLLFILNKVSLITTKKPQLLAQTNFDQDKLFPEKNFYNTLADSSLQNKQKKRDIGDGEV